MYFDPGTSGPMQSGQSQGGPPQNMAMQYNPIGPSPDSYAMSRQSYEQQGMVMSTISAPPRAPPPSTTPRPPVPIRPAMPQRSPMPTQPVRMPLTTYPPANSFDSGSHGGSIPMSRPTTSGGISSQPTPISNEPESDQQILSKARLDQLVMEVDPHEQLDVDVKEVLLELADDFVEQLVTSAAKLAKHRKATSIQAKDVQICLERNWNMWIPGFGAEQIRPQKKAAATEAHRQRMALIKKTMRKL